MAELHAPCSCANHDRDAVADRWTLQRAESSNLTGNAPATLKVTLFPPPRTAGGALLHAHGCVEGSCARTLEDVAAPSAELCSAALVCIESSSALQRALPRALLSLSSHALRRVFGPPNFGLSRQFLHAPQSALESPGTIEFCSGRCAPPGGDGSPPISIPPDWTAAGAPPPP